MVSGDGQRVAFLLALWCECRWLYREKKAYLDCS